MMSLFQFSYIMGYLVIQKIIFKGIQMPSNILKMFTSFLSNFKHFEIFINNKYQ